jgi:non-ribosomal peptide synthetase component F
VIREKSTMAQRNVQLAFCDAAERFAEVTAIEHQDRRISYAELERNSNRLCHFLRDAGVKRGDAVAILADDTVIVVTAILGVLKAGAAFVPLDPRLPPARLEAMLAVARPALILADDGTGPLLARIRPEIVWTDSFPDGPSATGTGRRRLIPPRSNPWVRTISVISISRPARPASRKASPAG